MAWPPALRGFGGCGEGVILIDLSPLSISCIDLSLPAPRIPLSSHDSGRVKFGFGLTCGGGGGCGMFGEGVILIALIPPSIPSSFPPSSAALTDRRKASACCRGDTCISSVQVGVKVGPLSMSQPPTLSHCMSHLLLSANCDQLLPDILSLGGLHFSSDRVLANPCILLV